MRLILFGDLTTPFDSVFRELLHEKDLPVLQSFFERASSALREEISRLPRSQQASLPRFTTLIDLLPHLCNEPCCPALSFALLCLCEIGLFIRYLERGSLPYPTTSDTFVLGICTGSFAAAAIACCDKISLLVLTGVESTLLAFRTARFSLQRGTDVCVQRGRGPESWSAIISANEVEATACLENHKNLHETSQRKQPEQVLRLTTPFISAVSPSNVTVSAAPPLLDEFISSAKVHYKRLPIVSPFHAPDLFDEASCLSIIPQLHDLSLESCHQHLPLILASGDPADCQSFHDILWECVSQTLRKQVRWDKIIQNLCATVKTRDIQNLQIVSVHSNAAHSMMTHIEQDCNISISNIDAKAPGRRHHQPEVTGKFCHSKIAVCGFSGRFPDAASNDEFWRILHEGRDTHRDIPSDRFDWRAHLDRDGKKRNTSRVQYGCFIKEPGVFDTRFFNMSPREAASTDPAQRLLITATYEALEMAGYVANRTPSSQVDRVGVFMGTTSDDWREVNSGQDIDTYFIPGGNRAFVPGRISYFFKFSGPSLSVDTACSSSFSAIHAACSYLWKGDCDTAIAGGTNVLTNPDNFAGLDRGHFLSTTGNCKPFDDAADGYCRADAVGSVILKRYEDAVSDNDPIYGIIVGAHTNHCGSAESITRPHEGDQASVFNRILRYTNQDPLDVGYVEMHGTGTQAGDATEMNSVLSCFVPGKQRVPDRPIYLGSAKANIGHAESASGVSSLIKVLLMLKNDEIPPHCGIKGTINRNYPKDLEGRNVRIALEPVSWKRSDTVKGKRTIFLNNFSAAGGNTAILLEDAPEHRVHDGSEMRSSWPVAVSARSASALNNNVKALMTFLNRDKTVSLANLSYTTTARRIHHNFRAIVTGENIQSIQNKFEEQLTNPPESMVTESKSALKIALVFTGQGSLTVCAGRRLFENDDSFRDDIRRFDSIATQLSFPSFLAVIDGSATSAQMETATVAHLAQTCLQMALFNMWFRYGVIGNLVVGHSLGEYAALYASGAMSAFDTIRLVGARASLLEACCEAGTHAMLSVKASHLYLQQHGLSGCEVACINEPDGTVLSGTKKQIQDLSMSLEQQGIRCLRLDIPYAFHSASVEGILPAFGHCVQRASFCDPKIPIVSPMTCSVISSAAPLNDQYLTKACRQTVNFEGALQSAKTEGLIDDRIIWLEIGPHPMCSAMIKTTLGRHVQTVDTLQKHQDAEATVLRSLTKLHENGVHIDWNEFHRRHVDRLKVVELPAYKWDLKNCWIPYRNNFCLTKGDDAHRPDGSAELQAIPPSLITSSVHRIVHIDTKAKSLTTETNLNHPKLTNVVQGHKVNGVTLCPSSLYADMAMTVVRQLLNATSAVTEDVNFDLADMQVAKPLVASGVDQLLRVTARLGADVVDARLSFFSADDCDRKLADHASCTVRIVRSSNRRNEWKRTAFLVNHRLQALATSVDHGIAHKLKQGIVCKLFSALVDYADGYRGMAEVILDSAELEATAKVQFQCDNEGFDLNPQWIDSLGHLAGFIMNGNDSVASKDTVFVNHGWENMQIETTFDRSKTYRTYNKMQPVGSDLFVGDTYIFEGDEIVAIFSGIKFQGVPRRVLDQLLPAVKQLGVIAPGTSCSAPQPVKMSGTTAPLLESPAKPTSHVTDGSSVQYRIKSLIADAIGLPTGELKPETAFDECGVDSLLSLNIAKSIGDEFGLDVLPSDFATYPTVGAFLLQITGDHQSPDEGFSTPQSAVSDSPSRSSSVQTSGTGLSSVSSSETMGSTPRSRQSPTDTLDVIKAVVASEVGIEVTAFDNATRFADVGVDSLLTLNIMSKLEEVLPDIDLPSSLLVDNETLEDIGRTLGLGSGQGSVPTSKSLLPPQNTSAQADVTSAPPAIAHLFQGSTSTATCNLFLFPDGSGSAFSYATLSKISPQVAVYGLACPWQKDPWAMHGVAFTSYSATFLTCIRKVQPHGPYHLGGWSAGGICAYEAAQQLTALGEKVDKLILIDSPNPIGLENPPQRMYDFFDKLDFFGMEGKQPPKWLRPHFDAFLTMLDEYKIEPWKHQGSVPKTHIIYAKEGVCSNLKPGDPRPEIREDDPREMKWLLNTRTDFSAAGWKSLVGDENVDIGMLADVNHFTMVGQGPKAPELAMLIGNALLGHTH